METYKKGEGTLVRRIVFFAIAGILVWGGQGFYTWLINLDMFNGLFRKGLVGGEDGTFIPVFNQRLNLGFVLGWGFSIVSIWGLWKWLNRPKVADFLIETEEELRKVSWPTWKDAWNSALIVLAFVALLTVFLWVCDVGTYNLLALALA